VRLRPQCGHPDRAPRQRAVVEVPDPALPEPGRLGGRARTTRVAALRAAGAGTRSRVACRLRPSRTEGSAPAASTRTPVPDDRRGGARRGAAGRRRRLQRLASARAFGAAALCGPARGVRACGWPGRPDFPRSPAAAEARPDLRAQRGGASPGRAAASTVDAPVRPCPARRRGDPVKTRWTGGNHFRLLENGEQFYPAVFDAIAAARHEVLLETFILFEDKVGVALHGVLLDAARRGVQVDVTIDGWGSPDLSKTFVDSL